MVGVVGMTIVRHHEFVMMFGDDNESIVYTLSLSVSATAASSDSCLTRGLLTAIACHAGWDCQGRHRQLLPPRAEPLSFLLAVALNVPPCDHTADQSKQRRHRGWVHAYQASTREGSGTGVEADIRVLCRCFCIVVHLPATGMACMYLESLALDADRAAS